MYKTESLAEELAIDLSRTFAIGNPPDGATMKNKTVFLAQEPSLELPIHATMPMLEIAKNFFEQCETGQGWAACAAYCTPDATFDAQSEPLTQTRTLHEYTDWMKGLLSFIPDGAYMVKSFAVDSERNNVAAYAVFSGTHTGEGGPCPPTGKKTATDYVYIMDFEGEKIRHMTKIWNAPWAMKELGWM